VTCSGIDHTVTEKKHAQKFTICLYNVYKNHVLHVIQISNNHSSWGQSTR